MLPRVKIAPQVLKLASDEIERIATDDEMQRRTIRFQRSDDGSTAAHWIALLFSVPGEHTVASLPSRVRIILDTHAGLFHRCTQGSHDALLDQNATSLSLEERLAAASYAAHLSEAPGASLAYRARLHDLQCATRNETLAQLEQLIASDDVQAGLSAQATSTTRNARLTAILSHTRSLVTLAPPPGKPALVRLREAGLETRGSVALSQLVAFVTYQVRVVAALRALEAAI